MQDKPFQLEYEGNTFFFTPARPFSTFRHMYWKIVGIDVQTDPLRLPVNSCFEYKPLYDVSTVEALDLQTIQGADKVRTLCIPAEYTSIRLQNAQFPNLETLEVDPDNPVYRAQDGMLLSKSGSQLHYALAAGLRETLVVPDSVVTCDHEAFRDTRCEEIVFPDHQMSLPVPSLTASRYLQTHEQILVGARFLALLHPSDTLQLPDTIHVLNPRCFTTHCPRHLYCNAPFSPYTAITQPLLRRAPLETLTLGPRATVHASELSSLPRLQAIYVDSGNKTLSDRDGVLFTDGGKTLRLYPPNHPDRQYTVPEGTRKIAGSAFKNASHLTTVIAPQITDLGPCAFQDCTALEEVRLDSLERIPNDLFKNCHALVRISLPPSVHAVGKGVFSSTKIRAISMTGPIEALGRGAFATASAFCLTVIDPERRGIPGLLDAVWPRKRNKQSGRVGQAFTLRVLEADGALLDQIWIPASFNLRYMPNLEKALEGPYLDFAACDEVYTHILEQSDRVQYAYFRYTELMRQGQGKSAEGFYAYLRRASFDMAAGLAREKDEAGIAALLEQGLLTDAAIDKLLGVCEQTGCLTALAYLMRATEQRTKSHSMPL